MNEGAEIFYIDNDSLSGMRPVLCRGSVVQKISRYMIENLLREQAIYVYGRAEDHYKITEKGRRLAVEWPPNRPAERSKTSKPSQRLVEKQAIQAFKDLAKIWPKSLTIVWTGGLGLWIARTEDIDKAWQVHDVNPLCAIGTTVIPSTSGA